MSFIQNDVSNYYVYQSFNQLQQAISGVTAIDHFFSKEMITALVHNQPDISSADTSFTQEYITQLTHLFIALSISLREGHTCILLTELSEQYIGRSYIQPSLNNTESESDEKLSTAGYLFANADELNRLLVKLNIKPEHNELLVFENNRLYMRRYYQFESCLAQDINDRLSKNNHFDINLITNCITQLFPDNSDNRLDTEIDWQKVAVANAINKNFSVIAGGPGTGKTYTVTKLLAALVMLAKSSSNLQGEFLPHIALVAPTGKAAQRLSESISAAIEGFKGLISDDVLDAIPTTAQTIHRLLGVVPNSPNFKHHQNKLLPFDVVLIDEVSMVDVALMTRIFRALKPETKVILLGDADQLPSVAAGSVLADIAPRPHQGYSDDNLEYLSKTCQLKPANLDEIKATVTPCDYLTFLMKSRRFDGQGGIGLIAKSVIAGDKKTSWQLLQQSTQIQPAQLTQAAQVNSELSLAQGSLESWLTPLVKQYYQPIEHCKCLSEAFSLLAKFRVLCATRQGEFGVEQINELIKSLLGKNMAYYQRNQVAIYHGQPIMVTENDYRLGLYNGDIGIIWRVRDVSGKSHLMACFEVEQTENTSEADDKSQGALIDQQLELSGTRQILPSRLPHYETVYAMTIHKTQGSEFSHVAMAIAETQDSLADGVEGTAASKMLSRELLYTGITRAKKQLTIGCNQKVWHQGVTNKVQRNSGLRLTNS